jgi:hypothetical protein
METLVQIACGVSRAQVIHGPGQLMGQDGQGFPLPRFVHQAGEVLLARRVVAEKQDGGFGERPCEVGMANFLAGSAVALAGGCFGTRDEPAVGDARLDSGEAVDIVDLLHQPKSQELADPWDGTHAVEGLRIMPLGGLDEIQLQGREQALVGVDQCEVHRDTLLDVGIEKALGHAGPVRLVGERLADLWEVVWAVSLVDMRQELGVFAHERQPAPEQVPRGPPRGGIDRGLGQPPAPQEHRDLMGIELIVFGLAPMDGLHGAGVAQHEGNPFLGADVGQPGPR